MCMHVCTNVTMEKSLCMQPLFLVTNKWFLDFLKKHQNILVQAGAVYSHMHIYLYM